MNFTELNLGFCFCNFLFHIKSSMVPIVTRRVPMTVFLETFSPRESIAIIAENIGVVEVSGATMFMLVERKPKYRSVSPIPKARSPLSRASAS